MAEDVLTPFIKKFFEAKYIGNFHTGIQQVRLFYFTRPDTAPQEIILKPYPFMTLYDLKIMIYKHFRNEISAHPSFQSLLLPLAQQGETNNVNNTTYNINPRKIAKENQTFEYSWTKPETTEEIHVVDPFSRIRSADADPNFVSESGKRNLPYAPRSRVVLEDFIKDIGEESLTLHLYLFKDIIGSMPAELRGSEREWFGRIAPYFPDLDVNQVATSLPEKLMTRAKIFDAYVTGAMSNMAKVDEILTVQSRPLLQMIVAGVKYLRFIWTDKRGDKIPLENLFYKLDVTQERPFLRILPVGTTPITKIKMNDTFKIPQVSEPRLLRIWREERNPKPDSDFMFSKLMIRPTIGAQHALYGTLRMFDDNTAEFIVQPPKQLRILDPRSDLSSLDTLLKKGLGGTPYLNKTPDIGNSSIICAVRLPLQTKLLSSDALRRRIQLFSPLFQEISPLPGDRPLIMLRYRAVSNYATEDKIFSFLTLELSRSLVKGDAAMPRLVVALQKEFQMSETDAQLKVTTWLRNKQDVQLAVPDTKDFYMTYNSGIDISIFGQQSYYTIHLYGIYSTIVFQRIITAIGLMLTATEDELAVPGDQAVAMAQVSNAVVVAAPGSEVREPSVADGLVDPPPNVGIAGAGDDEEAENTASGDNDMLLRLMMGAPGGDDDEDGSGGLDEDAINLGDALDEGQNVNLGARRNEERRNANALVANVLNVAPPPAPSVPAPAPVAAVPQAPRSEEEEEEAPGRKRKSYQGWVKSQLQLQDQRLFQYDTDVAGRKIKKYVTMCQATESRQPFVLNQEQYDVMRETYMEDRRRGELDFIVYPLEQGQALPEEGEEVYTLLKYGTNPLKQNYYLCCQFFCTKDYILVREKDFNSTVDRQGKPKPSGSCPFCHKLEIKILKSPGPNEAVIQRRTKKADDKRHLYVGFLQGETQHPEEFYMPCCFTEDSPLYISDPRFDKVRAEQEEEKEEEAETKSVLGVPTTSYEITMLRAHKKYIIGPEKEYLKISEIDGPQVGLLPAVIDKYFGQEPKDYVSRESNKMELLPNAKCFLRVGVENRSSQRHDSFFAALAPYIDRNSSDGVRRRIKEVFTSPMGVRLFTFLNYGNLVLEFYDPNDPTPPEGVLRAWIGSLQLDELTAENKDAVLRIYKSYHRFLTFLDTPELKEYRQFAQMLALEGILTTRGLVLIVLELNEKNELSVRCPPFGYNIQQYANADVAFILHRSTGIWEPIFYSGNKAETRGFKASHQYEITFQRSLEASWPPIVRQRMIEFSRQCQGIGRSVYTSSRKIDPMALIPVSQAIENVQSDTPVGVVRDAYNHIVALTYKVGRGRESLVALPVIDDEYWPKDLKIHLDWDDFTPAPLDLIVKFYKEKFQKIFASNPKYRIIRRIKSRATGQYVAVQLANRLYIPAGKPLHEEEIQGLRLGEVDEMEWSLNRAIYFGKKEDLGETLFDAKESDMQEIFEHLRLTFSNWFTGRTTSSELRTMIRRIIEDKKIPLFERRKRLEIILGPMILSWMDSTKPRGEQEGSLLRVDCLLHAGPSCPARCVWRQKPGNNETAGQCLIHAPTEIPLGARKVNGPRLLMLRLLEELLRFPERKTQLLTGTVTTLVALKEAVKIGEQYILPESSIAWQDLMRLDWMKSTKEQKKFYEELSSKPVQEVKDPAQNEEEEKEEEEEVAGFASSLPDSLMALFDPEDPKTRKLSMLAIPSGNSDSPLTPYLTPLGISLFELDMPEDAQNLDETALRKLTRIARRPILYFDTIYDPPQITGFSLLRGQKTSTPYIFISTEDGLRVLSSSKEFLQDVQVSQMPSGLLSVLENEVIGIPPTG